MRAAVQQRCRLERLVPGGLLQVCKRYFALVGGCLEWHAPGAYSYYSAASMLLRERSCK